MNTDFLTRYNGEGGGGLNLASIFKSIMWEHMALTGSVIMSGFEEILILYQELGIPQAKD